MKRVFGSVGPLMMGGALAALAAGAASAHVMSQAVLDAAPATAPAKALTFNVYLPLRNVANLKSLLTLQQKPGSANYHKWLTPAEFDARFGPSPASVSRVQKALEAKGLTVVSTAGTIMKVSGTAARVNAAFATTLKDVVATDGTVDTVAAKIPSLPDAMKAEGANMVAFAGIPKMRTNVRHEAPSNRTSAAGGYYYNDLKQAYGYPSYQAYDGTGTSIAVVIDADPTDTSIAAMFNAQNFSTTTGKANPTITHTPIDSGTTSTSDIDEADLDVQQMIGGAPGAKVSALVIPDLYDDHIMDGYNYAVTAGGTAYQAINSSFGECELYYEAAYNNGTDYTSTLTDYDNIFMKGNAEGITFVASSGDNAGLGCLQSAYFTGHGGTATPTSGFRFVPGVETPAASAYVTAVGGTNLITSFTSGNLNSTYVAENAYGDPETNQSVYYTTPKVSGGMWGAGGGVSVQEAAPAYMTAITGSTFRTTPDLGMQVGGCPGSISVTPCGPNRSYVVTYIGTTASGLIGTSVASPEFVGALALYIQKSGGGVGNVTPYLYAQATLQNAGGTAVFNRGIPGFNGQFTTAYPSASYNYSTGNGTPKVATLFGLGTVLAGTPQTASNP